MKSGWYNESHRHALASKGIKTAMPKNPYIMGSQAGKIKLRLRDSDHDGVPNKFDCSPHDPTRQHAITRYVGDVPAEVMADKIKQALAEEGYDVREVTAKSNRHIDLQGVRLGEKYLEEKGYNISPYSGRRGRILNWDNWVEVNNTLNKVLDEYHASANIKSLGGKFKIREGTKAYTEDDWDEAGYQNVGSMMSPVDRKNAWASEGVPKVNKEKAHRLSHLKPTSVWD